MRDEPVDCCPACGREVRRILHNVQIAAVPITLADATRDEMKTHWNILVVDDEEVMCMSLAAWLREDGYGVDSASSGAQALEMARQKEYAIYFIDLKMPGGMDGIETMMEIR